MYSDSICISTTYNSFNTGMLLLLRKKIGKCKHLRIHNSYTSQSFVSHHFCSPITKGLRSRLIQFFGLMTLHCSIVGSTQFAIRCFRIEKYKNIDAIMNKITVHDCMKQRTSHLQAKKSIIPILCVIPVLGITSACSLSDSLAYTISHK